MSANKNPGLPLAFGSALAFALGNVGVRLAVDEITVWGLVFLRGLLGVAVIAAVALWHKKQLWGGHGRLLSAIGLCGFLSTACTFTAISRIPLYQALVILYLYPILAIALAAAINGEKIFAGDILRAFLALGGCLLLIWPDETAGLALDIGHLVGLTGSLLYSLSAVLTRRLGQANSGLEPFFNYSLWCSLGAIPLSLVMPGGNGLGLESWFEVGTGLLAVSQTALGQFLLYAAVRWLPAHKAVVIGTLEVAGGALASWLIFQDPITARAALGGVIILSVALSARARG